MKLRMNMSQVSPDAYKIMQKLEGFMSTCGLDKRLYELIKIRASQINGCAFCLDMHTTDLRAMGEEERRVHLISVWRETPWFTEQERIVLELTEEVTLIANGGVPQDVYDRVRVHFDEAQTANLIMAIVTINAWNRIAISTGMFPGCFDTK